MRKIEKNLELLINIFKLNTKKFDKNSTFILNRDMEMSHSGLVRPLGKRVFRKESGVRIPSSPPKMTKKYQPIIR